MMTPEQAIERLDDALTDADEDLREAVRVLRLIVPKWRHWAEEERTRQLWRQDAKP